MTSPVARDRMKPIVLRALEAARHDLVNLNGLIVADGAAPKETFTINNRKTIALIDEALSSLAEKPAEAPLNKMGAQKRTRTD